MFPNFETKKKRRFADDSLAHNSSHDKPYVGLSWFMRYKAIQGGLFPGENNALSNLISPSVPLNITYRTTFSHLPRYWMSGPVPASGFGVLASSYFIIRKVERPTWPSRRATCPAVFLLREDRALGGLAVYDSLFAFLAFFCGYSLGFAFSLFRCASPALRLCVKRAWSFICGWPTFPYCNMSKNPRPPTSDVGVPQHCGTRPLLLAPAGLS